VSIDCEQAANVNLHNAVVATRQSGMDGQCSQFLSAIETVQVFTERLTLRLSTASGDTGQCWLDANRFEGTRVT
jgi:hypothetical protein